MGASIVAAASKMVGAVTTAVSKSTGGFTIVCVEDNPQHQTRRGEKKKGIKKRTGIPSDSSAWVPSEMATLWLCCFFFFPPVFLVTGTASIARGAAGTGAYSTTGSVAIVGTAAAVATGTDGL